MAVWDGQGADPWLPDRLARDARIAAAERDVYRSLWAELSAWIVSVRRAVSPSPALPPEPMAVWAFVPAWEELVGRFVSGPILDVMGLAFRTIFGDDYEWDARPGVAAHLAAVTNRMVRTPDMVFNLIATAVAEAAGLGEGIPKIAERVRRVLSTTETEQWPNRAVVVARTETLGALNAGRHEAFNAAAEDLGGEFERLWLATDDSRTRPTHRAADMQRVPVGTPFTVGQASLAFPGDPSGPAHEVIQCRCTQLLVRPGEEIDLSNRHFTDW